MNPRAILIDWRDGHQRGRDDFKFTAFCYFRGSHLTGMVTKFYNYGCSVDTSSEIFRCLQLTEITDDKKITCL